MNKKLTIAYGVDQYWPVVSGVPVSVDTFRREIHKNGYDVHLLAPDYPGADEIDKKMNNKNIHRFASHGLFFMKLDRFVYRSQKKKIFDLLDRIKPDIIHIHTEFTVAKTCLRYALKKGIPVLCTAHTNYEQLIDLYIPFLPKFLARLYVRMTLRRIYDKTDRVIVPTLRMKSLMLSYMIEKPLMIIPTGISKSEFEGVSKVHERSHSNFFKQFPILVGKKILLYAGRIGWEKNLNFLVDMLGRVVQEQPNTVLLIAGDGPYREDMEHLIHRRGLSHNVVFAGIVPKKEMKKVYALADVFVFSSKVETQGLVTIEAMICGTPVVAIGEMGTRDVMSGNNGGFMTHDDLGEFTRRVLQLLTDEKLYWKKSHEAMLHAEAYTIERFAKMTTDLYDSLVVQKRHRKKNYQDRIREMWRGLA